MEEALGFIVEMDQILSLDAHALVTLIQTLKAHIEEFVPIFTKLAYEWDNGTMEVPHRLELCCSYRKFYF